MKANFSLALWLVLFHCLHLFEWVRRGIRDGMKALSHVHRFSVFPHGVIKRAGGELKLNKYLRLFNLAAQIPSEKDDQSEAGKFPSNRLLLNYVSAHSQNLHGDDALRRCLMPPWDEAGSFARSQKRQHFSGDNIFIRGRGREGEREKNRKYIKRVKVNVEFILLLTFRVYLFFPFLRTSLAICTIVFIFDSHVRFMA